MKSGLIKVTLLCTPPKEGFACYDDSGNMTTIDHKAERQISVFLSYPHKENWDICEIYIVSQEKILCVSQHDIALLSKNTEL